MIEQSDKGM